VIVTGVAPVRVITFRSGPGRAEKPCDGLSGPGDHRDCLALFRGCGTLGPYERKGLILKFLTRASDSEWIGSAWSCVAESDREMTSVATPSWGLVFWARDGRPFAAVTGPETRTGTAPVPAGASFVGIEFAVGTSLRVMPASRLVDSGVPLDEVTSRSFELAGSRWETPGLDDVEALVERLVRAGVVVRDPLVKAALQGDVPDLSPRTVERRFRAATGLTQGAVRQIERARDAAVRLADGTPTADVVTEFDYFDEPHLAKALQRFVGRTAGQLREGGGGAIALDLDQWATV
jgi:hypothetical protein